MHHISTWGCVTCPNGLKDSVVSFLIGSLTVLGGDLLAEVTAALWTLFFMNFATCMPSDQRLIIYSEGNSEANAVAAGKQEVNVL